MKHKNNFQKKIEFKKNAKEIILQKFGENLKTIREKKEVSQETVAFVSGISRSYYAEVESGKRNPSLFNITKILAALEVGIEEVLSYNEIERIAK